MTATDLMYLESRTPFALRRSIAHAATVDEVVEAASHMPQVVVSLTRAGVVATDIGRVLALQSDTRHHPPDRPRPRRARRGPRRRGRGWRSDRPPAGRRRSPPTRTTPSPTPTGATTSWYAALAADVNDGLARCGFGADNAEVLARNRQWRMSESEWQRVFRDCLDQPDRSHLTRAAVAFDFRHVCGGLQIVRPLVEIERQAPEHPDFLRRLARTATDFQPPLGFRGRLQIDDDGRIDIKRGGVVPIANLARFHALQAEGHRLGHDRPPARRRPRPARSRPSGRRRSRRRSSSSPACGSSTRRPRSRRGARPRTGSPRPTWRRSPAASS